MQPPSTRGSARSGLSEDGGLGIPVWLSGDSQCRFNRLAACFPPLKSGVTSPISVSGKGFKTPDVALKDAFIEEARAMTMMKYEPWNLLDQMRREMDRAVDTRTAEGSSVATSDWVPAVDIKEEKDSFVIVADIPGVDPQNIEVHMENGMLTIKGEKESEKKEEREGYKRVERSFGSFYRRFSLPDTADAGKITAKSNNGVLEVRIAKQDQVQPRKISVNG